MKNEKYINPGTTIYIKEWLRLGKKKNNGLYHIFHDNDDISIGLCETKGNFFIEEKKISKDEVCKRCIEALMW